ncbi:zinc ribbon domain-containing protein [Rhodoferax sp.]|uniref:FmdB family zinc ribbon protein n=1 Tax=Rhodoferax sp. TaxID=50421 RepID=UPI00284F737D|nr:zinc ribbon domain-containing protein [Rhodoferax sp.]MDR3368519.1 zinc ribbon domain-containing protein [Rhodoferax sp.]
MPIYEYACKGCGHKFETLVRSDTVPQCPNCLSTELDKQLSVFATTAASPEAMPMPPSACSTCPNAGGPGSCAFG